jgi:hypothetical protein
MDSFILTKINTLPYCCTQIPLVQDMGDRIRTPHEMSIRPLPCILEATKELEFSGLRTNCFPYLQ